MTTASILEEAELRLGDLLLQHRQRHGLSLPQAGAQVGATKWVWRTWERGVVPSPAYLRRLGALLGLADDEVRRLAGPDRVRRAGALGDRGANGLAAARLARGLTASDLARRLHVSQSCVSRWESGERLPSARARVWLAQVLDLDGDTVEAIFDRKAAASEVVAAPGLRNARQAAGRSQAATAARLGVDPASLRRWESAGSVPLSRLPATIALLGPSVRDDRRRPVVVRLPRQPPLRRLRQAQGLAAVVLAGRVGVTPATIWAWERGHRRPDWRTARRLANALCVPVGEVFTLLGLDAPQHLRTEQQAADPYSAAFLREVRRWNGLTQDELAQRLGVGRATVADWERGRHRPGRRARLALQALLPVGVPG